MAGIDIGAILQIIAQVPKLIDTVTDIVDGVKGVVSEQDKATLDSALATLQTQNDIAYKRVRAKLADAAKH